MDKNVCNTCGKVDLTFYFLSYCKDVIMFRKNNMSFYILPIL